MSEYWYEAFIAKGQRYVLVDDSGDIRASAPDIDGIVLAQIKYGWGKIHKFTFNKKTIEIGEEIK